jgi:hypothetical protein
MANEKGLSHERRDSATRYVEDLAKFARVERLRPLGEDEGSMTGRREARQGALEAVLFRWHDQLMLFDS